MDEPGPDMNTARIRIERLTPEGQGLGRIGDGSGRGRVVFVPYTAPGDLVEAELLGVKPGYARARIRRLLEPGPGRVEPRCPHHFRPGPPSGERPCGGCDWQHLSPAAQLEAKRELIRDCLFRIAKLREPRVEETLPSPESWRYRNKVLIPFGVRGSRIVAGFYAPGTHRIVDFGDCHIQPEISVRATLRLKALAKELGWKIYDEDRNRGWLRHFYMRKNREGGALAALVTRTDDFPGRARFVSIMRSEFPEIRGLFQNVQPMRTSVVLGPKWIKLWGSMRLEERIGDVRLKVSPGAFLQVNTPACEVLYGVVRDFLCEGGFRPELVLDLYCGAGAIALWAAPYAHRVLGIDENRDAVSNARAHARANGVSNARFIAGKVESRLGPLGAALSDAEPGSAAAIVDPPRAGCTKSVLKTLRARALARVIYVSCNPATFARDADWLSRHGWTLKHVRPVDLFPQTSHVELAALFTR